MGGRLLEGPTMVGGTWDWKDERCRPKMAHKMRQETAALRDFDLPTWPKRLVDLCPLCPQ